MYNGATGELLKISADGTQETLSLGLPEGVFIGATDMAFNYNGTVVTFCYLLPAADGGIPNAHLVVRDLTTGTNAIDTDLGQHIGCHVGKNGFGFGGMSVFVGLANDPASGLPLWELLMVEPFGGTTIFKIDAASPDAAPIEPAQGPMLPYVRVNDAQQVTFALVPYGIGGPFVAPAYSWSLVGPVTPVEHWGDFNADVLLYTGEMAWPAVDESLPVLESGGPIPGYNVVEYLDRDGNVSTVYQNSEWIINDVTWVNNGEQLAINLFTPNFESGVQDVRWVLIGRDGSLTEMDTDGDMAHIYDTENGYLVHTGYSGEVYRTELTRYLNGEAQVLWSYEDSEMAGAWQFAWAPPSDFSGNFDVLPAVQ
jgi:hypothetical protein